MRLLMVIFLCLGLASCASVRHKTAGYFNNRDKAYLHSKNGVDLKVPPPLSGRLISHYYDVHPTAAAHAQTTPPPEGPVKRS
jgi:uncharacterized lipoprotein